MAKFYPNNKVVFYHLGGILLHHVGRMSWGRFNKLRFNIGLLPKLWSYFKQIWKERRSYNFYSFYGHWVTSFFTLSERYCQYPIFSWRKSKWKWKILPIYPIIWPEKKRREAVNIRAHLKGFFIKLEKNCADNNWSSMNNLSFLKWSQFSHVLDLHWFWAIFLDCFRQASEESTFKSTSCESIKNVINPLYILHGTVLPHCFHSIFNNLVGNCHHVLLDIEWWWIHKNKYN